MAASAVLYVGDLDRMIAFYSRVFGLDRADDESGYATLLSTDWELTLVQSPDAAPPTQPAPRRSETAVKLCFAVDDLDATGEVASTLNATMDPPENRWVHRGHIRCDLIDPEGNVVGLIAPE